MALERRFWCSGGAALTLERHVGGSNGVMLALERRVGRSGEAKLALDRRFGRLERKKFFPLFPRSEAPTENLWIDFSHPGGDEDKIQDMVDDF